MKLQAFQYEPWDSSERSIQLLRVVPASADGKIRCHLNHIRLTATSSGRPRYAALSYTCGDPEPKHEIVINDKSFAVQSNLFAFLLASVRSELSTQKQFQHLWTDAICFDQNDLVERRSQVEMMYDTFSSARPVIIWNAVPDTKSDMILSAAKLMCRRQILTQT